MTQTTAKHTPGPWRFGSSGRTVLTAMGERVATVRDCDEAPANVRLIAAAPDMAGLLERVSELTDGTFSEEDRMKNLDDIGALARIVLAAAEGR